VIPPVSATCVRQSGCRRVPTPPPVPPEPLYATGRRP
jgi:hypothetical protein